MRVRSRPAERALRGRFAAVFVAVSAFLVTGACSDLPDVGVVGQADGPPLAVFKECDEPDARVGRLTVYRGGFDGPKLWSAAVTDEGKAVRALELGVPTDGYRTTGSLPGREDRSAFVFEAEDTDGVNLSGASFRWRDLRDGMVLLDRRDDRYRRWPQWSRCK